jgi:hypothetical protein
MARDKSTVLDLRRANNVGIGLSRFYRRLSDQQILDSVINRTEHLSLDDLLTLKTLLPTEEERESLMLYKGDKDGLTRAEKFMLTFSSEPNIGWMVDALIFERQFDLEVSSISDKLITITGLLTRLRESPSLKILLKMVLEVGNLAKSEYGRSSHDRGKALGISISSLSNLHEVKSVDRSSTLLHYLVESLNLNHPEVLEIGKEFEEVGAVKGWDTEMLVHQVEELQNGLKRLKPSNILKSSNSHIEKFRSAQSVFIQSAGPSLANLSALSQSMRESWTKTAEYFGDDPSTSKPDTVFTIFDQFFRHLMLVSEEVRKKNLKRSSSCTSLSSK